MHRCPNCGAAFADADPCDCRRSAPAPPLRADGGQRDGSDDDRREEPEAWKQGRRPPHWERNSPSRSDDGSGGVEQGGAASVDRRQPVGGDGPDGRQSPAGDNSGQQGPRSQPTPGTPQQPPRDDGGLSLGRRELLAGGAGAAALAAGGWWMFLRGRSGPGAVVADFLGAIDDADYAAVQAAIHEDGPVAETFPGSESEFQERMSTLSVDIETLEQYDEQTPEEFDGRGNPGRTDVQRFALVFAAFTVRRNPEEMDTPDGVDPDEAPTEDTSAQIAAVARTDAGQWKLWEMDPV